MTEIFIALRSDLKDDPNRLGSGTSDDPFDGSKTSGGVYKLDAILRAIPANSTIYFEPGVFPTQGFKGVGASTGFWVKSGWRIVGGGWSGLNSGSSVFGATVFQLEGHVAGSTPNYVFQSGSSAGEEAFGFEMAYVSIDSNLPNTSGVAAGAIRVNGSHIRIHHVRVFGFGAVSATVDVIDLCHPTVSQQTAKDNVLYDCVIESPSLLNSSATVNCVRMGSSPDDLKPLYHEACVVRGNYISCSAIAGVDFRAIAVSGGRGTIIEQNEIWDCTSGVRPGIPPVPTVLHATMDLIIRDNFFFNVTEGINLELNSSYTWTLGRAIIVSNIIELLTTGSPTGIKTDAASSASHLFKQIIIRSNEIRHTDGASGPSGTIGITLDSVADAIIENNLINIGSTPSDPDTTKAIMRNSSVISVKTFNNQSSAGIFLGCWDGARHDGDIVTDVELGVLTL